MDHRDPLWTTPPPAVLPDRLRPFVQSVAGYAADGLEPGIHRGLPGRCLTLVLALDAPLGVAATVRDWSSGHLASRRTVLGGLHTEPAIVVQPGRWSGVQVELHPLGARRLLDLPASALPTVVPDLPYPLGEELDQLHEQLVAAPSWAARYAVVHAWLLQRLGRTEPGGVRRDVAEAWRFLAVRRGRASVVQVAEHVGLGRRRLAQVFGAELGVSPRTAGRLMRFDAARRDVATAPWGAGSRDLSGIAVRHGYFDHAHLVRDFTEFTGLSPTRWLAAERANIQAAHPGGAAASEA